jgi:uncharacterized HhH-GPD family protein
VRALLAYDVRLTTGPAASLAVFTDDPEANAYIHTDAFAFLVAVVCDQGIVAERAWAIPYLLRQRLGHLDPARVATEPAAVSAAFRQSPQLHRFVNDIPNYVVRVAAVVAAELNGDAARLWSDQPSASELRHRFEGLPGIRQKKAAVAVELLERFLHVPLADLSGSDVAYDVHVRRVFLRTGLAERDEVAHMVATARQLYPERPGALDNPAWWIGRT